MSVGQKMKLNEAGVTLIDCDHKTPTAQTSGYPYVGIPQLKNGHIRLDGARLISEEDFVLWTKKAKPKHNDVILSRRCNPGESAYVPEGLEIALGQNLVLLRSDGSVIYPPFLRWLVQGNEWWKQVNKFLNVGAVFNSLKCKDIPNFNLTIPSLNEQKRITDILSSLDNKIELNNKVNQTLESIAQALFKSWFIDFDPVRAKIVAKLEGADPEIAAMCVISGKSEAELKKMPEDDFAELQATAALFPDELVESELGEVPKGWFKTDLSILADLNVQSWTKKNCPEKVTYVDLSNTKWGVIQQTEEFIFEKAPSRARRVLKIGDTIVGTVRPANGSYAFIQRENLTGSTGFAVLSPKHKNYAEFIYIVATDKENIKRLAHLADGGAYPAVSYDTVLNTPCILPIENKDGVLNLFHKNVKEFYLLSASKFEENNILASIRDTLLPKLLSGELDVSCVQDEVA